MTDGKRWLALLTLSFVVAGLLLAAAASVHLAVGAHEDIDNGRATLSTLNRTIRDGSGVAAAPEPDLLLAATSAGSASAELQDRINALAKAMGANVRSVQALAGKQDSGLLQVAIEVNLQSGVPELRNLLHELETSQPLAIVDELSLRFLPTAAEAPARAALLEVSMKVRGFASTAETKKP